MQATNSDQISPQSSPDSAPNSSSKPQSFTFNTGTANKPEPVGSLGITDPEDPFFVHSNNAPNFKYKYPQARPTPDGEDDAVWNKTYTAADSRMYNKHHKSANESRKYRESGETRILSLRMMSENKEKHYRAVAAALAGGQPYVPKAPPKPRVTSVKHEIVGIKKETSEESWDMTPGAMPMSISEKIKSEGRKRKAPSDATSSQQGTPAPSSTQRLSSPAAPKLASPVPPRIDNRVSHKKKGTAAPLKRPPKKSLADGMLHLSLD